MKDTQRITITLPREIYTYVKDQAEQETRSFGEQITYFIRQYQKSQTQPQPQTQPQTQEIRRKITIGGED